MKTAFALENDIVNLRQMKTLIGLVETRLINSSISHKNLSVGKNDEVADVLIDNRSSFDEPRI